MEFLYIAAAVASLAHSSIALSQHDYGYALALFGAFGAWSILAAKAITG